MELLAKEGNDSRRAISPEYIPRGYNPLKNMSPIIGVTA
jgi:hypothetical protein